MTEQIDYRPPSRSFTEAIQTCLSNLNFSGRASRSEYWWFFLFCFIVQILAYVYGWMGEGGWVTEEMSSGETLGFTLSTVAGMVLLPPSVAVGARRLHDTNLSGWWQLLFIPPTFAMQSDNDTIALISSVFYVVLFIVLFVRPGKPKQNRYDIDSSSAALSSSSESAPPQSPAE